MLKQMLTIFAAAGALSALPAGDVTFHRGGVTFPMEKISAERFAPVKASAAENLFKNSDFSKPFVAGKDIDKGWNKGRWLFGDENRKKFFAQACKLSETRVSEVEGGKVLDLNRPAELEKLMGATAAEFYISATQKVVLPDDKGGIYKVAFQYRSQKFGSCRSMQGVLVYYQDALVKGKNTRSYQVFRFNDSPQWTDSAFEMTVPAGTRVLSIAFRCDGPGRTLIRNVSLVKAAASKTPLELEVTPMKMLDNTYVLGSGDPGILAMRLRNTLPKGEFKKSRLVLEMELPDHVEVLGANAQFTGKITSKAVTVEGKKYKKWFLPVHYAVPAGIRNSNNFTGWNIPAVMLKSSGTPGTSWKCSILLTDKDGALSNKENFTLRIDKPLFKIPAARNFLPGFSSVSGDIRFTGYPAAREAFAKFVAEKSGTRWITASMNFEDTQLYRKHGVKFITAEPWAFANGFRLGRVPNNKKPAYSIYRDVQGRPVGNHGVYATCPAAVYLKTPYYKDVVVPAIRESVKGLDGFTPNWEPYSFRNVGCFCDTCKKEFAKFAKIPADKIDSVWPAELQLGKKYRETAIKFRGWQHAQSVLTIHAEIMAAGGKEVGMCPEVGTDQILNYEEYNATQGEFSPYCYADKTKWLNVWGPYVWFIGDRPYVYTKAGYLRFWETIRRAYRDYTAKLPGSRAKLLAMPHGNQVSTTALGQPEGMAMDQISAYLAGFHASQLYFFPRGYDHRFWRELGRSSLLIALTEDIVMNGKKVSGVKVTPETPFPGPVLNISPRLMADVKSSEVLQVEAFVKGKKYLAAVGNFWEKGDVIFKLSFPGLKAKQTYSVKEIPFNRQFTKARGVLFTGKDLKEGILLHAGALRWVFFEITEADAPAAVAQLTAADMLAEKKNLDKANKAAADAEHARDKALRSENDFGEWQNLSRGGFACKVIDPKDKNLLQITSGKSVALINPRGLVIDSLKINGVEQLHKNFGLNCFWNPGKNGMQSYNPYRVTGQSVTAKGLQITAECVTSGRTYPALPGLKIKRIVTFSKDLKEITLETILENPSEMSMDNVGFRWYFMPAAWNNSNGGFMEIAGKKISRPHGYSFYKKDIDAASEEKIRSIFLVKNPTVAIAGSVLNFKSSKGVAMDITLEPAAEVGGVAVWDTASLFAATCEPFYKPVTIAPGGNHTFKAVIRIK